MIRSLYRSGKGGTSIDSPEAHWRAALRDRGGLLWVDIQGEPTERIERLLADVFGFHPLAIDDALRETHVPKVDDWGEYLYCVAHAVVYDAPRTGVATREIDIFLGHNYLVTYHSETIAAADRLWEASRRDAHGLERGPDYLLYHLLDLLVADFMPVIDQMDEAIDRIEDEVFDNPAQATLNRIFTLKRAVLRLRRILSPQREAVNRLARDAYAVVDAGERVYFRDIYDHLVRLVDLNDTLRDLIGGALDTYLSVASNRINEIVKVLTVLTAVFQPLTFFTAFFGMNFTRFPYDTTWLLLLSAAVLVGVPLLLYRWFRRRGWV
jgi:magnesium transporter